MQWERVGECTTQRKGETREKRVPTGTLPGIMAVGRIAKSLSRRRRTRAWRASMDSAVIVRSRLVAHRAQQVFVGLDVHPYVDSPGRHVGTVRPRTIDAPFRLRQRLQAFRRDRCTAQLTSAFDRSHLLSQGSPPGPSRQPTDLFGSLSGSASCATRTLSGQPALAACSST